MSYSWSWTLEWLASKLYMNTDVTYITLFNTSVPSFEGSYLISNNWSNLAGFRNKSKLVNTYRYDRIVGTIFVSWELWGRLQFGRCKFYRFAQEIVYWISGPRLRKRDRSQRDVFEWVTLLHIIMFALLLDYRLADHQCVLWCDFFSSISCLLIPHWLPLLRC